MGLARNRFVDLAFLSSRNILFALLGLAVSLSRPSRVFAIVGGGEAGGEPMTMDEGGSGSETPQQIVVESTSPIYGGDFGPYYGEKVDWHLEIQDEVGNPVSCYSIKEGLDIIRDPYGLGASITPAHWDGDNNNLSVTHGLLTSGYDFVDEIGDFEAFDRGAWTYLWDMSQTWTAQLTLEPGTSDVQADYDYVMFEDQFRNGNDYGIYN